MSKVNASLAIQVYVNCPKCNQLIDIMDPVDTDGFDHNGDSEILRQACPVDGSHWIDSHEYFAIDAVTCTECKHEFDVEGMDW